MDRALRDMAPAVDTYCWLQSTLAITDVANDYEFQTRFNGFYRVRGRNAAWRSAFYRILEEQKSRRRSFAAVLRALHTATERVEASFASKLVASVDPDLPVIDKVVLSHLGLRLPRPGPLEGRLAGVVELHEHMRRIYARYLRSDRGRWLRAKFEAAYPDRGMTPVKMLDLVLWKTRNSGQRDQLQPPVLTADGSGSWD